MIRRRIAALCTALSSGVEAPFFCVFIEGTSRSRSLGRAGGPVCSSRRTSEWIGRRRGRACRQHRRHAHRARVRGPQRRAAYFLSTAYVCGTRTGTIAEEELDGNRDFRNAYEESKPRRASRLAWMRDPSRDGLRPSIVVGDSGPGPLSSGALSGDSGALAASGAALVRPRRQRNLAEIVLTLPVALPVSSPRRLLMSSAPTTSPKCS